MRRTFNRADYPSMTDEEFDAAVREARQHETDSAAKAAAEALTNGINHGDFDVRALARALANDHPTLLGQVAKAVGMAVMIRASYDPDWKPFAKTDRTDCDVRFATVVAFDDGERQLLPRHVSHDGRLDCTTVVGAQLMARQSYI